MDGTSENQEKNLRFQQTLYVKQPSPGEPNSVEVPIKLLITYSTEPWTISKRRRIGYKRKILRYIYGSIHIGEERRRKTNKR